MIYAMPQMNGNPPEHFRTAAKDLMAIADTVDAAISKLNTDVFHGRNYQHSQEPEILRRTDLRHTTKLAEMATDLRALSVQVFDAAREDRSY
jgi:hypothetical protein